MSLVLSRVVTGSPAKVGTSFEALRFRHTSFDGLMSPLVLVDDYIMTAPTFGPHPHAGFSSVTLALEDGRGEVLSEDSIGNRATIRPGDVHWTLAGSGVIHSEEVIEAGIRFHGLQVFVNLPERLKNLPPASWLLQAKDIPVIERDGARVRVLLGSYGGETSPGAPPVAMLALDCRITSRADLPIALSAGWNGWLYVSRGKLRLQSTILNGGQACALSSDGATEQLAVNAIEDSEFIFLAGPAINEPVIEGGPFIMGDQASLERVMRDYRAGKFGHFARC